MWLCNFFHLSERRRRVEVLPSLPSLSPSACGQGNALEDGIRLSLSSECLFFDWAFRNLVAGTIRDVYFTVIPSKHDMSSTVRYSAWRRIHCRNVFHHATSTFFRV